MLLTIVRALVSVFQSQRSLAVENLALRHQFIVLQRTARRPGLSKADRLLWVLLSRLWSGWRETLTIVRIRPLWQGSPRTRVCWPPPSNRVRGKGKNSDEA